MVKLRLKLARDTAVVALGASLLLAESAERHIDSRRASFVTQNLIALREATVSARDEQQPQVLPSASSLAMDFSCSFAHAVWRLSCLLSKWSRFFCYKLTWQRDLKQELQEQHKWQERRGQQTRGLRVTRRSSRSCWEFRQEMTRRKWQPRTERCSF